jgi:tRNA pseudouridine13 synthase
VKAHIGIGLEGVVKKKPEDFIVEEIHDKGVCTVDYTPWQRIKDIMPIRKKKFLHFTLVKRDLTTQRAVALVAKALRISKHRLSYAGIKDRVAITGQRVSIEKGDHNQLRTLSSKVLSVKDYSYTEERTYPGHLIGNRFTVTIKDIPKKKDEIQFSLRRFEERSKNGIRNYFGEQRFGSRQNNHTIGKHILKDEYREAVEVFLFGNPLEGETWREFVRDNWGKWQDALRVFPNEFRFERSIIQGLKNGRSFRKVLKQLTIFKLFVHSYQSYVFNRLLEETENVPETLPLIGKDTVVDENIAKILEEDGVRAEYFSFKGTSRKSVFVPKDFKVLAVDDSVCKIRFSLPKGTYATVLLNELNSTRSRN